MVKISKLMGSFLLLRNSLSYFVQIVEVLVRLAPNHPTVLVSTSNSFTEVIVGVAYVPREVRIQLGNNKKNYYTIKCFFEELPVFILESLYTVLQLKLHHFRLTTAESLL